MDEANVRSAYGALVRLCGIAKIFVGDPNIVRSAYGERVRV